MKRFVVEANGKEYVITPIAAIESDTLTPVISFKINIDGKNYASSVKYTYEVRDELKENHNIDLENELLELVKVELSAEIENHLNKASNT